MGNAESNFKCNLDEEEVAGRSPLSRFIERNFRGANVTVSLVNGQIITGEVVNGFDNVIGLKMGNTIIFVNERFIVTFI